MINLWFLWVIYLSFISIGHNLGLFIFTNIRKGIHLAEDVTDPKGLRAMCNLVMEKDFRKIGRNIKTLGLEDLTIEEIKEVFQGYAHYKF